MAVQGIRNDALSDELGTEVVTTTLDGASVAAISEPFFDQAEAQRVANELNGYEQTGWGSRANNGPAFVKQDESGQWLVAVPEEQVGELTTDHKEQAANQIVKERADAAERVEELRAEKAKVETTIDQFDAKYLHGETLTQTAEGERTFDRAFDTRKHAEEAAQAFNIHSETTARVEEADGKFHVTIDEAEVARLSDSQRQTAANAFIRERGEEAVEKVQANERIAQAHRREEILEAQNQEKLRDLSQQFTGKDDAFTRDSKTGAFTATAMLDAEQARKINYAHGIKVVPIEGTAKAQVIVQNPEAVNEYSLKAIKAVLSEAEKDAPRMDAAMAKLEKATELDAQRLGKSSSYKVGENFIDAGDARRIAANLEKFLPESAVSVKKVEGDRWSVVVDASQVTSEAVGKSTGKDIQNVKNAAFIAHRDNSTKQYALDKEAFGLDLAQKLNEKGSDREQLIAEHKAGIRDAAVAAAQPDVRGENVAASGTPVASDGERVSASPALVSSRTEQPKVSPTAQAYIDERDETIASLNAQRKNVVNREASPAPSEPATRSLADQAKSLAAGLAIVASTSPMLTGAEAATSAIAAQANNDTPATPKPVADTLQPLDAVIDQLRANHAGASAAASANAAHDGAIEQLRANRGANTPKGEVGAATSLEHKPKISQPTVVKSEDLAPDSRIAAAVQVLEVKQAEAAAKAAEKAGAIDTSADAAYAQATGKKAARFEDAAYNVTGSQNVSFNTVAEGDKAHYIGSGSVGKEGLTVYRSEQDVVFDAKGALKDGAVLNVERLTHETPGVRADYNGKALTDPGKIGVMLEATDKFAFKEEKGGVTLAITDAQNHTKTVRLEGAKLDDIEIGKKGANGHEVMASLKAVQDGQTALAHKAQKTGKGVAAADAKLDESRGKLATIAMDKNRDGEITPDEMKRFEEGLKKGENKNVADALGLADKHKVSEIAASLRDMGLKPTSDGAVAAATFAGGKGQGQDVAQR